MPTVVRRGGERFVELGEAIEISVLYRRVINQGTGRARLQAANYPRGAMSEGVICRRCFLVLYF